LNLIQII